MIAHANLRFVILPLAALASCGPAEPTASARREVAPAASARDARSAAPASVPPARSAPEASCSAEFGAIPLCSKLPSLPDDAAPLGEACDLGDAATGCRFATARDAGAVRYLVLGGVVRVKEAALNAGAPGPFGVSRGDSAGAAAAKVKRATGLTLTPAGEGNEAVLQSDEQECPGNAYRVVVALDADGRATDVMLTTLPAT